MRSSARHRVGHGKSPNSLIGFPLSKTFLSLESSLHIFPLSSPIPLPIPECQ